MDETQLLRSFVGIQLPQELLQLIEEKIAAFKKESDSVRWVRPKGRHITLYFLGSCDEVTSKEAKRIMDETVEGTKPFQLRLTRFGVFPNWKKPKVLWVGVDGELVTLTRLAKKLTNQLASLNFSKKREKYTPHITLGRFRNDQQDSKLVEQLRQLDLSDAPAFEVNYIGLHQRGLRPPNDSYVVTHKARLGAVNE